MSIPEGATHQGELGRYYKCVHGEWFYANNFGHWRKYYSGRPCNVKSLAQPKPWSGPEDWLPPVGVEVYFDYQGHPQGSGKVLFYGNEFCIVQNTTVGEPYEQVALIEDYRFKSLHKTGSLIDERETAIREIMDVAQVDCRVTAARLVDAGFARKMVRSEENRSSEIESMKKVFDSVSDDLVPTSNKYLETLFGALCDAGFKREVV